MNRVTLWAEEKGRDTPFRRISVSGAGNNILLKIKNWRCYHIIKPLCIKLILKYLYLIPIISVSNIWRIKTDIRKDWFDVEQKFKKKAKSSLKHFKWLSNDIIFDWVAHYPALLDRVHARDWWYLTTSANQVYLFWKFQLRFFANLLFLKSQKVDWDFG